MCTRIPFTELEIILHTEAKIVSVNCYYVNVINYSEMKFKYKKFFKVGQIDQIVDYFFKIMCTSFSQTKIYTFNFIQRTGLFHKNFNSQGAGT